MDIFQSKIAQNFGIVVSKKDSCLLCLNFNEDNHNHVQTMHASASYALAEISSGVFLEKTFPTISEHCIPILRSAKVKYKSMVKSDLHSVAKLMDISPEGFKLELELKRRALCKIDVRLVTEDNQVAFAGEFEWFITLN
jgi:hypothetical protein